MWFGVERNSNFSFTKLSIKYYYGTHIAFYKGF